MAIAPHQRGGILNQGGGHYQATENQARYQNMPVSVSPAI
jgi:hypothetical protein